MDSQTDETNYYKYLKYKSKYLKLYHEQFGGARPDIVKCSKCGRRIHIRDIHLCKGPPPRPPPPSKRDKNSYNF